MYEQSLSRVLEAKERSKYGTKSIIACCLEGIAEVALALQEVAWAVLLFGAAESVRITNQYRNPVGIEQSAYARNLAEASSQLGEKMFTALWKEGRDLTPEQALAAETLSTLKTKPASSAYNGLTNREIEVLRLIAAGLSSKQMAQQLAISPSTVNVHIQSIYGKVGSRTRSGATRYAIEHRLI